MKKFKLIVVSVILILLAAVILTGCAGQNAADDPTETTAPTLVRGADVSQPEWTPIEIPIFLKDNNYLYAQKENFLCFAFVGSDDSDVELRFMFTDETAEMLRAQNPENHYYISIGDEEMHIGDVTLNDDCTIATLKGQHPYDDMTAIASRIRGLN